MTRLNGRDLDAAFLLFLRTIGGREAKNFNDHGGYRLENGPGGYRIVRIADDTTGEFHPFGDRRMPLRQMYQTLHFAVYAFEERDRRAAHLTNHKV